MGKWRLSVMDLEELGFMMRILRGDMLVVRGFCVLLVLDV